MHISRATSAFAALSQETRLRALHMLARTGRDGMLSGELGDALGIRPNTMSTNLGILMSAGLVHNRREGRTVRYFANFEALDQLAAYFVQDCCDGAIGRDRPADPPPAFRVEVPARHRRNGS